ncbi:MAG: hypothetical protein ACAH80_11665 [Alphaproteobacteria bacterium]
MARAKKAFSKKAKKADEIEFEFFSDLDGVLTNFDQHAKDKNKYDDKGALKWDALDYEWWSTMPAYDGAKKFYDGLRERGRTRMLTAPILNAGCFRGKAEWVKEFRRSPFGLLDLVICRADDKELLARPNHILVDDRQKNIDGWVKAGGIGILHTGDYADTMKRVDKAMENFRKNPTAAPKHEAPAAGKFEVFIGPNGVLADFQGHLETQGKITPEGKTEWDKLDIGWWKTIPSYDGARAFYDEVREMVKEPGAKKPPVVRFLTGPVPNPDGFEGDAAWTMKFKPESGKFALMEVICCRSKDKLLLARPNHVLIDDRQENIDAWTKAGGIGILHSGDYADTLKRLKQAMADYNAKAAPAAAKPAAPKGP